MPQVYLNLLFLVSFLAFNLMAASDQQTSLKIMDVATAQNGAIPILTGTNANSRNTYTKFERIEPYSIGGEGMDKASCTSRARCILLRSPTHRVSSALISF